MLLPVANKQVNWTRVRRFMVFTVVTLLATVALLSLFQSLLIPLFLSIFIAFLLMPVIDFFEGRSVPRLVSTLTVLIFLLALMAFGTIELVPLLIDQSKTLVLKAPAAFQNWYDSLLPTVQNGLSELGFGERSFIRQTMKKFNLAGQLMDQFQLGMQGAWETSTRFFTSFLNGLLVPFFCFFWLKDKPRIREGVRGLIPVDLVPAMSRFGATVHKTLREVLKGTALVAVVDMALYMIGFSMIDLDAAITIGFITGICRVIPYLDLVTGLALGLISSMSHFEGWAQVIGVVAVVMIVQGVDAVLIAPRIIGEKVGLHPAMVIVSILVFGKIMGFWGVLLAIPLAAVAKALWTSIVPYYLASAAFDPTQRGSDWEDAFGHHHGFHTREHPKALPSSFSRFYRRERSHYQRHRR